PPGRPPVSIAHRLIRRSRDGKSSLQPPGLPPVVRKEERSRQPREPKSRGQRPELPTSRPSDASPGRATRPMPVQHSGASRRVPTCGAQPGGFRGAGAVPRARGSHDPTSPAQLAVSGEAACEEEPLIRPVRTRQPEQGEQVELSISGAL